MDLGSSRTFDGHGVSVYRPQTSVVPLDHNMRWLGQCSEILLT